MVQSIIPCDYVDPDTAHPCGETPTELFVVAIEDWDGVEVQRLGHRCALHAPRGPDDGPSEPERPDDPRRLAPPRQDPPEQPVRDGGGRHLESVG